ncbi:MAG TPA: hypothetical protein DD420_15285 [Streptomyces sp.]|nr:hypothetical protein [Streptomyces sp.]
MARTSKSGPAGVAALRRRRKDMGAMLRGPAHVAEPGGPGASGRGDPARAAPARPEKGLRTPGRAPPAP